MTKKMDEQTRLLRRQGKTTSRIARLQHRSETSVRRALSRSPSAKPRARGRPRKHSRPDDQAIIRRAKRHRTESLPKLARWARKKRTIRISPQTVSRILLRAGLQSKWQTKKPLLTEAHRQKRLAFARTEKDRDWSKVVFLDETTFTTGPRKHRVRAGRNEFVPLPTIKHPPKVHVWGGVSAKGKTKVFIFTENLDAALYTRILNEALLPSLRALSRGAGPIQQDNDPKHNAKVCLKVLTDHHISRVLQPPQSPDLNPLENVWNTLKDRVAEHNPGSAQQLRRWIQFEWDKMRNADFLSSVLSMPQRCQAVIDAQGGPTRY